MSNPFFEPSTETGIPAFDKIEFKHYREAIDRGFAEHDAEIAAIIANPAAPSFANTVEALERSGGLLRHVFNVFWNMASSDTTEALQALEREWMGTKRCTMNSGSC
jgi:peptidyl-dipeptidase Dcp